MKSLSYTTITLQTTSTLKGETVTYEHLKAISARPRREEMTEKQLNKALRCPRMPSRLKFGPDGSFPMFHKLLRLDTDATELSNCLNIMVNGESFKKAMDNKFVKFIVRKMHNTKEYDDIVGNKWDDLKPDHVGQRFAMFHASTYLQWKPVRAKIMEVIRLFELEAILIATSEEYEKVFGERDTYNLVDSVLCYFVFSLVHFEVFQNRQEEFEFFKELSGSNKKTQDCLKLFNTKVSCGLIMTPSKHGKKELLNRTFLRLGESEALYLQEVYYQEDLHKEKVEIHYYFDGKNLQSGVSEMELDFIECKVLSLEKELQPDVEEVAAGGSTEYHSDIEELSDWI